MPGISSIAPAPVTGGWLPEHKAHRHKWLNDKLEGLEDTDKPFKHQSVIDLKDLIEGNPDVAMLFDSMFKEIPYTQRNDPTGEEYKIYDYKLMLRAFDKFLTEPPKYGNPLMVALPFSVVLEWPMATRAGLSAFLHDQVNRKLGAVLNEWGKYLSDPTRDSNKVINSSDEGWLSKDARDKMRETDPGHHEFEELYYCPIPNDPNRGFGSWDAFFTRVFNKGMRDVAKKDKVDTVITSGCESAPYAIKQRVKASTQFWVKGQPYSLRHMLACSEDEAKKFAGGTVYQAFLSPITYHRWHAPINGVITKARFIRGTYYSVSPTEAFPDADTYANTQSQAYLTAVATRALFYIKNDTVRTMVMSCVGMVEVSTCAFADFITSDKNTDKVEDATGITYTPKQGIELKVQKGDEIGMFHYGGSTHCLIFDKDVNLNFRRQALPTEDNYFVPLNTAIADVVA